MSRAGFRRLAALGFALALLTGWLWREARGPAVRASPPPPARSVRAVASAPPPSVSVRLWGTVVVGPKPVAGARVIARGEGTTEETLTDAAGHFSFELAPGGYGLSASAAPLASPLEGPLLLAPSKPIGPVTLELLAAATVEGVVRDAASGQPIAHAHLRAPGGEVEADAAGRFRLEGLPAQGAWLEATAPGFVTRRDWLTLEGARELGGLELYLQPAAFVRGRVVREAEPVGGALVWAESALVSSRTLSAPVTTGPDGRFELSVEAGAMGLFASTPTHARVEGPRLSVAAGAHREGLVIALRAPERATGQVSLEGSPVAGAELRLLDAATQRLAAVTLTDSAGAFNAPGLSSGAYLVEVRRGSLAAQRGPFETAQLPWKVQLERGRKLFGRVVPAEAGARVSWRSTEWAGESAGESVTDAEGRFWFDGAPEGRLRVEAEGRGGSALVWVSAGEEVVLTLERSALEGLVVDARGHPVNDFTVRLLPRGGGLSRAFPMLSTRGDFRLEAAPGAYLLTASAPGHGEIDEPLAVEVGAQVPRVRVVLPAAVAFAGVVQDARSGAPLAEAEVVLHRLGRERAWQGGRRATLFSDAEGRFSLGAAPADAALTVRKQGYLPVWASVASTPRDGAGRWVVSMRPGRAEGDRGGLEPYEGIGAQLAEVRGQVQVAVTFEGSPAEMAGLLPGDVLLAVDGRATQGERIAEVISRVMGPAGTVVRLSLERGGQRLDLGVRRRAIRF